eukprot:gb/GFBE01063634.1/.p1 GENE.gb/GFBE01063634.1/~~gb/GFBE01063634.1/.p1  ORF type:complete len:190 (+),score=57.28 gb/GFBE01063634.1/:1-570(+)
MVWFSQVVSALIVPMVFVHGETWMRKHVDQQKVQVDSSGKLLQKNLGQDLYTVEDIVSSLEKQTGPLDDQAMEDIQKHFREEDSDGDGFLSQEELSALEARSPAIKAAMGDSAVTGSAEAEVERLKSLEAAPPNAQPPSAASSNAPEAAEDVQEADVSTPAEDSEDVQEADVSTSAEDSESGADESAMQ